MSIKSILVHVQPFGDEDRLACAVDLAKRLDAALIGLGAEGIPPALMNDTWGAAGVVVTQVVEDIERDLKTAQSRFTEAAADRPHTWRFARGAPTHFLATCAAMADLVLVALPKNAEDVDTMRAADVGEVIVSAGRPVLFAPQGKTHLAAENVLVAWKNTREARRAVADALPFLTAAKDVLLLVVGTVAEREDDMAIAEHVAENLRRHGAPVRTAWESRSDDKTPQVIQEEAARMGADLIVAGGYGHSRLDEWIFGGVTRALLRQSSCFVLFSH